MRYPLLLLVSSLLSLLSQQYAIANMSAKRVPLSVAALQELGLLASSIQTTNVTDETSAASASSPNFWPQAQQLVQDQIYLINHIQRALTGSDLNRVLAVREQLTLHQRKLERFLKSQYPVPAFGCEQGSKDGSSALESRLSNQQTQVYCALLASSKQLTPLGLVLEHRLPGVADLTSRSPLPPSQNERLSFREPAPSKYLPMPNLPPTEMPLIGRQTKTPIADYVPPMQPAIALPSQAAQNLRAAKQLLAPALAAFPTSDSFIDPESDTQAIDQLSHAIYYKEPPLFAQFLAQPHTGIVRVLPVEAYHAEDLTRMGNRLQPTVKERFPFAPLLPSQGEFTPRLALQIENGNFDIAQGGLDYGFMVDLGEVSIEDLRVSTGKNRKDLLLEDVPNLSPPTQQFFFNYRPPTQMDAIQVDKRRFITGKLGNLRLSEPVLTQVPAVRNHTYLLRLVQYKLPQAVVTGESVSRSDREYLNKILATKSSDLLVAFRPVIRRSDGSYTVLWRVLTQFPDPQITDLEKYVYFE